MVDSEALAAIHQECFEKAWSPEDMLSYLRKDSATRFGLKALVLFYLKLSVTKQKSKLSLLLKNIAAKPCMQPYERSY